VAEELRVSGSVSIPADALAMKAVRSSGPGGQNVNKVASKVELRVDPGRIRGLSPDALGRLLAAAGKRLDAQGRIVVASQRTRDRHRNLEDARGKLRALVARCLAVPKPLRQAARRGAQAPAGSARGGGLSSGARPGYT
jgi:ribosome-associated protein